MRTILPDPQLTDLPPLRLPADRRATPPGWCHSCGWNPCVTPGRCQPMHPRTFEQWVNILTGRVEDSTEGLEGRYRDWTAEQADLARAIAAVLVQDADFADERRGSAR